MSSAERKQCPGPPGRLNQARLALRHQVGANGGRGVGVGERLFQIAHFGGVEQHHSHIVRVELALGHALAQVRAKVRAQRGTRRTRAHFFDLFKSRPR